MENITPENFQRNSWFIFELREKAYLDLIKNINDLNSIKPNDSDVEILNTIIQNKKSKLTDLKDYKEEIDLKSNFKSAFFDFKSGIKKINEKMLVINNIIITGKKRENISLRKICKEYKKITGISIAKSSVHNIMRNKLNFRFLKTVPKTNKINTTSSKIRFFLFMKVVIKSLFFGLKIVYIDESNFQLENNHLRVWRKNNEFPLFNVKSFGRRNIILAISDEKVILYTINKGTNNNETFFCFMTKLVDNIGESKISEYLIIMDNCTIHLHQKLKDFYKEKRMKILTIVPYASQLNGVELVFGLIKQKVYKKIFSSLNKLETFVEKEILDLNENEVLNRVFLKTYIYYKDYIINNINCNLNEI